MDFISSLQNIVLILAAFLIFKLPYQSSLPFPSPLPLPLPNKHTLTHFHFLLNTRMIIFNSSACISSRHRYLIQGPSEKEGRETRIEIEIGTEREKGKGTGRNMMECLRWTRTRTVITSQHLRYIL